MSLSPRVRFAPSPTGPLHVGALRTALFNYLFAKGKSGHFLLRIEDTDRSRLVPGAKKHIEDTLEWMGIAPDEPPTSQSEAQERHITAAHQLHEQGKAYYAFDTPEELQQMRERLKAKGLEQQHYNALTRMKMKNELTLSKEECLSLQKKGTPFVLRFKVPPKQLVSFKDLIRGHIRVQSSTLEDKVLLKADQMPTYHLAHVVDDHRQGITHVIRGEEWLPSTALHLLLYEAFGWQLPVFVHLPLILSSSGKGKLSKRSAEQQNFPIYPLKWQGTEGFKERGFLSEALFNFLACLGWQSSSGKELLTRSELLEQFSLDQIAKSGARFDIEKAKWYNEQYLRFLSSEELVLRLKKQLPDLCQGLSQKELLHAATLMQPRVSLLSEIITESNFLRQRPKYPCPVPEKICALAEKEDNISQMKWKRYALTAAQSGPDLKKIIDILGEKESTYRLKSLKIAAQKTLEEK